MAQYVISQSITYMKFYNNISLIPAFVMLLILEIVAHKGFFAYMKISLTKSLSRTFGLKDRKLIIDNIIHGKTSFQRHPPNKPHPLKFDIKIFLNFFINPKIAVINSKLS